MASRRGGGPAGDHSMEMDMDMEDDSLSDDIMFCPRCNLALYPTADAKKYFLMSCRACKYELDYEFSWEKHKVNGKSILAKL